MSERLAFKVLLTFFCACLTTARGEPAAVVVVVDITTCGAISGGLEHTAVNTLAFATAFAKAGEGGRVLVPGGDFYSGPITYGANGQTLELAEGSRVIAAWEAYGDMRRSSFNTTWPIGPPRPEGPPLSWDVQYAPLLYAKNKTGVQLVGTGTIDGRGDLWWALKDKTAKHKFPTNMQQRPFTIRFDSCNDVLVRDVSIAQPPFWCLVPTWCHGFKVYNVSIIAKVEENMVEHTVNVRGVKHVERLRGNDTYDAWNTDGIEPMYTTDVHIAGCYIENGDDSITIKSGSRNVLVEDCVFQTGHGCNVGSVQDGNIDNVTFRNIKLNQTLLGGGRIKARHYQSTWMVVSNVLFENISCVDGAYPCIGNSVAEIDMGYGGGPFGKAGVTVRNATWRNINVSGAHINAGYFSCLAGNPCSGIVLDNVHSGVVKEGYNCSYASGMSTKSIPMAPCLSSPPSPVPPSPGPTPPSASCTAACAKDCPGLAGKKEQCKACVKLHNDDLKTAGCWADHGENGFIEAFCDGQPGPSPSPPPPPPPTPTPPSPSPPGPGPNPPSASCMTAVAKDCPKDGGKGDSCKACVKLMADDLKSAGCWIGGDQHAGENAFIQTFCYSKPPGPSPGPSPPGPAPSPTPPGPSPPPLPLPCAPSPPGPSPAVNIPTELGWIEKQKRGGLVWAAGNCWQGLPWRDDPATISRSAQFGNGYAASILGGPEVSAFLCAYLFTYSFIYHLPLIYVLV